MRLLLTRPAVEAERTRRRFAAAGHTLVAAPVLAIEPLVTALDLTGVQALAVTSRQGLAALADATPRRDLPLYAVGDATAEAARAAGFTQVESAAGALEDLTALLAARIDPAGGRVLHLSGENIAGELGETLRSKGIEVVRTPLYRARPVEELDRTALDELRGGRLDGALFFSPRSAKVFARLAVRHSLEQACGRLVAYCLSAAVAERAAALAWRRLVVAAHPDLPSLLAAVQADASTDGRAGE